MERHRALLGCLAVFALALLVTAWGCSSSVAPAETFLAWWPVDGPIGPDGTLAYVTQLVSSGTTLYAAAGPSTRNKWNDSIIAGDSVWMFRSVNDGDAWSLAAPTMIPRFSELVATPSGALIGCSVHDNPSHAPISTSLLRSDDGGHTWVESSTGITHLLAGTNHENILGYAHGLASVGNGLMLFVDQSIGGASLVYRSEDDGVSWSQLTIGAEAASCGTAFVARNGSLLIGCDDGVRISSDHGATWRPANVGLPLEDGRHPLIRRFTQVNDSVILANVAHHDREKHWGVVRSTNGGASWKDANSGLPEWGWTLVPVASGAVYACESMSAFRSSNGGATWDLVIRESCEKPESPKTYLRTSDGHFLGGGKGIFKTSFALK